MGQGFDSSSRHHLNRLFIKKKINKELLSWSLLDWANSSWPTVIITFIFSTYFVKNIAPDEITGTSLWGYVLSVSGLAIQLGSQIFVNIGSTIGLIPTTGTTLPFISYGGSSMISMALNIGVILALTKVNYKDNIASNEKEF